MVKTTFNPPDFESFCELRECDLVITGQLKCETGKVLECRPVNKDRWCRECGGEGRSIGTVARKVTHLPFGQYWTQLLVRLRRYRCEECERVWRDDISSLVAEGLKLSHHAVGWALKALVIDRLSISKIAQGLGVSWHTVNDAIMTRGQELLLNDPSRFQGVKVIGVDEHCWSHTGRTQRFVTVVIDLTPVRDGTGPARLLDMFPGRSKSAFKTWLSAQSEEFRDGLQIVAMDGFTGFKTAVSEEVPQAISVMDPFHVVALAGDALDRCRQRVQQETCGRRGRKGDLLYVSRKLFRTGIDFLTERQFEKVCKAFAPEEHVAVEATWTMYQRIVFAYRSPDRKVGKKAMKAVIDCLSSGVPSLLTELTTLGRTLKRRAGDILAYFDHPRTSNGPTEAINGRLEHLRGTALGFRNLTNYIARALLDAGGFRDQLHRILR